jgi:Fic family protein
MFVNLNMGELVPLKGTDRRGREWSTIAFVPAPLPATSPDLTARTFNAVAEARAELARLDASAHRLVEPTLLRQPALRHEAQSTSALEGTYAPLEAVLAADESDPGSDAAVREVLNYVTTAERAFSALGDGRTITVSLLEDLHASLVRGTMSDTTHAGRIRSSPVMIGSRAADDVRDARYVPPPPGTALEAQVRDLLAWVETDHTGEIDPLVKAALAHYQFEALHPFNDGNGRIGRLLVVLEFMLHDLLREPTLTVSPWFEARRSEYYDRLLAVSTHGDWNGWVRFFARGIFAAARSTSEQVTRVLAAQTTLKDLVRESDLRADTALRAVDFATSRPIFTVRQIEKALGVSYPRANSLVNQLIGIHVFDQWGTASYDRRFTAPRILEIILTWPTSED